MRSLSPIHIGFGPLADARQAFSCLRRSLAPWLYKNGRFEVLLCHAITNITNGHAFLFVSAREGLLAALQAMGLEQGDEIVLPAYTCIVVTNAIRTAGGVPVFADIDPSTLNLSIASITPVLSETTRAVICQHTFGIPTDAADLHKHCAEKKLHLIESCTHIVPDDKGPHNIGVHGDVLLYSFGKGKALCGIGGGAVVSRGQKLSASLQKQWNMASHEQLRRTFARLMFPVVQYLLRPAFGVFPRVHAWCKRVGIIVNTMGDDEKKGSMPTVLHRMPNACCAVAYDHVKRRRELNDHRRQLTSLYHSEFVAPRWSNRGYGVPDGVLEDLPLQVFPLVCPSEAAAKLIHTLLQKQNIYLMYQWSLSTLLRPSSSSEKYSGYVAGQCPAAEEMCGRILLLPTHPTTTLAQAKHLISVLEEVQCCV